MNPEATIIPIAAHKDAAPATGSYSPGIRWGDLIFVSGQGPIDRSGQIVPGTIEDETALTIANIAAILEAAGSGLDQVLSCSCFIADMAEFDRFDRAYAQAFGGHRPARTTVGAALGGIRVEISAIAVRKPAS
jgi:2-iminobutanoate/2-iminopropanoate deaminase